jgi:Uma2 family endonuclease
MAGAKNVHNTIAVSFLGTLYGRLRGRTCQPFNSDTKVRIELPTHTRFYYPDGMIVCQHSPPEATYQDWPAVIAEVVSESTRRTDEGEKRDAYFALPSLRVYLLIEQESPLVTAYRRTEQGFVRELYDGLDAVVPLGEVDAELPLAELYERVEFRPETQPSDDPTS